MTDTSHLKCMTSHVLSLFCLGLCHIMFLLPDSGGCARKRAAMSVTLTSVKRVQSSPNLLAAGITSLTHGVTPEWLHLTSLFPESSCWNVYRGFKCLSSPPLNLNFSSPKNSSYPFSFCSKNKKSKETDTFLKTNI